MSTPKYEQDEAFCPCTDALHAFHYSANHIQYEVEFLWYMRVTFLYIIQNIKYICMGTLDGVNL